MFMPLMVGAALFAANMKREKVRVWELFVVGAIFIIGSIIMIAVAVLTLVIGVPIVVALTWKEENWFDRTITPFTS